MKGYGLAELLLALAVVLAAIGLFTFIGCEVIDAWVR